MPVELLAWDRRSKLLKAMRDAGVRLYCSPWRWGCRWALPDWWLVPPGLWKCRNAPVVLFGKTLRPAIHTLIHRFGKRRRGPQRFVYVTPYRPAEMWGALTGVAAKREVKVMLGTFDLILTQNSEFAGELRAVGYEGPIEVLPYLPPAAAAAPAPYPEGALTIGFLGRLEPQKNLPALLNIFARLSQQAAGEGGRPPPPRLRLIGEGSQKAALMALARKLGIEQAVEFCGAIPRERVREAVQSCHVFGFTSHTEGQCLAALEILAEGRPIIATAVGAFSDVLSEPATGTVVPSGDEPAFLEALSELLRRQKNGRLSPAETVQAYQRKFNREAVVRKYVELLTLETPAPETPPRNAPG